mmetsp:Transcript_2847/g.5764  ORF Transcript_2847/g.5764 Transcript_2847/m.5764 type:complete len:236 (-) Transcript_2847:640-1347(-)
MCCFLDSFCHCDWSPSWIVLLHQRHVDPIRVVEIHVEQSGRQLRSPSMFPALSSKIILGLDTIPLVNKMEGIGVINVLLWAWNRSWLSFPDAINLLLPVEASINYLGRVEVGKSPDKVVVGPNCIGQALTIMLPHDNFIRVLLHCLLLLLSISPSLILLCCPHHVDLPLVPANQCHDVSHVDRVYRDTMALPFEVVKHDVVEVDPLLKGCSVLMLGVKILITSASVGPDKELVCP